MEVQRDIFLFLHSLQKTTDERLPPHLFMKRR